MQHSVALSNNNAHVVLVGVKELQADRKKDNRKWKKLINGIHTGINAKS